MRRWLDILLLVALVAGGVAAWRGGSERRRLEAEATRLSRIIADLPVEDNSRVHIRALKTDEPLHFAWRIHVPANFPLSVWNQSGFGGPSTTSHPRDFIARVRFRQDADGTLHRYEHIDESSSIWGGYATRELGEFLRGRTGELIVEQLGVSDVATLGPDEPAVLLRLSMPEPMEAEAKRKLTPPEAQSHVPVLYEARIGPQAPKPPAKATGK